MVVMYEKAILDFFIRKIPHQ